MSPAPAAARAKPLMVFDGECHFCRRWIERWKEATAGRVEYAPFQEVAAQWPQIALAEFEHAVKFIEPDGRVFSGAEAVFRALEFGRARQPLRWSYDHIPGFAAITDTVYAVVARNRVAASRLTRWLWGDDVRRPTYFTARRWFFRALGAIYLIAFLSLWAQVDGLIGAHGILPIGEFLTAVREQIGVRGYALFPTLCWLNASDSFLHFLCGGGAAISVLLIAGIAPPLCAALLFIFYLSLTIAGQTFLSFQWDILLLETGFLAIFFAPWQPWPRRASEPPLSRVGLFLLQFLLFKLMLMSGVVKLTSGDQSWFDFSALDFHYETQPLPTPIAWFAAQHAEWFKHFSVFLAMAIELIAPLLIWAPRRLRLLACGALVFLQICIAATGNYGFFNLLTAALCLLLIDDAVWPWGGRESPVQVRGRAWPKWISVPVAAVVLVLGSMLTLTAFRPAMSWPPPLAAAYSVVEPFRIVNGYGLFRVMTKSRAEIIIEGSNDGINWTAYEFKWKPGDVRRRPEFVAPHQPRLDWQMWFAALGTYRENPWFVRLIERLLRGTPEVTSLLARDPFPDAPPRSIRARLFDYHFTDAAERRRTGAWWRREEIGSYLPTVSLENFKE